MDLEQVVKLLALMESHDLDEVEIEQDDMRIRLKKGGSPAIAAPVIAAPVPVTAPLNNRNPAVNGVAPAAQSAAGQAETGDKNTVEVPSPMVGTFFRAPSPETDPFVSQGDHVTADTVICIIEAMKVMNEIKAEVEGEVIEIPVENGESVEYGQTIMVIRPTDAPQ